MPADLPGVGSGGTALRRVVLASAIGSALEWYDYFIYGTAAALIFGELFFPKLDPTSATLAAFASFGVGFVARPFGGLVFGHFGDRLGRKPILVATLLLVGGGTALIGLLPTYDQIGGWAPVLLVLLRLVQGFGAGAEYGGAVIFAVEHAPPGQRGRYGSFAPMGVSAGLLLAMAVFAIVSTLDKTSFVVWGWRIPFLLSFALVALGIFIRASVFETPVFRDMVATQAVARAPVAEAIRQHPRSFIVVIGARLAENGLGYLYPVFGLNYLTTTLGLPRSLALTGMVVATLVEIVAIAVFSALSDRVGRRPVYLGAALFSAALAFPFFWLVDTRSTPLIFLALALAIGIGTGGMFGPQAAYFAELFGPRLRYSGFAFARELGSILAGGPAPFVSAWLVASMGGRPWGVALYVVVLSLLTALAVFIGPETYRLDITSDQMTPVPRGRVVTA
ncbi:MAG TPA: MFS transporter [Xanthobacteraceae bacterium]|nr:MFS transporter [Xanthobacteraceae bacterium]